MLKEDGRRELGGEIFVTRPEAVYVYSERKRTEITNEIIRKPPTVFYIRQAYEIIIKKKV